MLSCALCAAQNRDRDNAQETYRSVLFKLRTSDLQRCLDKIEATILT